MMEQLRLPKLTHVNSKLTREIRLKLLDIFAIQHIYPILGTDIKKGGNQRTALVFVI